MKTIGLLGGMSWESTLGYYKAINEGVRKSLGGLHSARITMVSWILNLLSSYSKPVTGKEQPGYSQRLPRVFKQQEQIFC